MAKYPDHPNYKPLPADHPDFVPPFHIGVPKHIFWEDAMDKAIKAFSWLHVAGEPDAIAYNAIAEQDYGKYVASLKARLEEMRKPDAQPAASKPLPPTKYNLKFF